MRYVTRWARPMIGQVMANQLGMNLYQVQVSEVINKYVGETSKRMVKLLSKAAHMNAILQFDEADGLFGRRSSEMKDAHDRYAATDTNALLVAIDQAPYDVQVHHLQMKPKYDNPVNLDATLRIVTYAKV